MANTVSNVYVQTFQNNLRFLAQQSEAKLRGFVQEVNVQSEKHNWERLGTIEATTKSGRLVSTPVQDTPWSRRVSIPQTYHVGDSTEQEDIVQMLVDPNSNLTRELAMAMKRKIDDVIIAAATSNATIGDGTTVAYDYTNQSVGDYTVPIDFDTVTAVQERFMENDIDPDMPKVAVIGPTQVRKLMHLTQQTSADFVHREALQKLTASGIVPNWMGFTWVMSTRLLDGADTGGGAGTKDLLFMTDRALGLQVNKDITARVAEDPSVSFAWRLYAHMTMGAVRVEDEQLVVMKVKDAIA
jgi:hypothetical protein